MPPWVILSFVILYFSFSFIAELRKAFVLCAADSPAPREARPALCSVCTSADSQPPGSPKQARRECPLADGDMVGRVGFPWLGSVRDRERDEIWRVAVWAGMDTSPGSTSQCNQSYHEAIGKHLTPFPCNLSLGSASPRAG